MIFVIAGDANEAKSWALSERYKMGEFRYVKDTSTFDSVNGQLHGLAVIGNGSKRPDYKELIFAAIRAGFDW